MNIQTSVAIGAVSAQKADGIVHFFFSNDKIFKQVRASAVKMYPEAASLLASGDFTGAKNTVSMVHTLSGKSIKRVYFVGLGEVEHVTTESLRRASSKAARSAQASSVKNLAFVYPTECALDVTSTAEAITEGGVLGVYKFDKYFTVNKTKSRVGSICIVSEDKALKTAIAKGVNTATGICKGVYLTRDLANAPNNEIYPETLAARAKAAGKESGFSVEVLDKKKITALKMGGLLAVNQGSVRPPVFIIMEYKGGKKGEAPIVLVGKGVTFDTGGISIKPGAGMMEMKMDMHGAASVIGTMVAVSTLKLPVNLVCLVPSTENMPSGSAYVPGDVITHMNGKTSEIDNTDAEGRLILADALSFADRYKPKAVVDIATLTGACMIALGSVTSGLMGTDSSLVNRLKEAGNRTGEYVCELPLHEDYEDLIKSDVADVKNSGGRAAGAITAALFLKKFIGNYPWAHVDIAGTGIAPKDGPYSPKGGSGVGVRLFVDMLRNW